MDFDTADKHRKELAAFRNSKCYDSIEESPFAEFLKDVEHSHLIDGNCVVAKREIPMFGASYIGYFVDCLGHISSIKASFNHSNSMEQAVAWLESNEFWVNKENYIAECDLPIYTWDIEHSNEHVTQLAAQFREKFSAYLEMKALERSCVFEPSM